MLAWHVGTFVFIGAILGLVLALYALYWLIFRMGKEKP
jgi:hypothetical protein